MEKIFLDKLSTAIIGGIQILETSSGSSNPLQLLMLKSKRLLEIYKLKNLQLTKVAEKKMVDNIRILQVVKKYAARDLNSYTDVRHAKFEINILVLDKNRSLFFLNSKLEEIIKFEYEVIKRAIRQISTDSKMCRQILDGRVLSTRHFGNKIFFLGLKTAFCFFYTIDEKNNTAFWPSFCLCFESSIVHLEILEQAYSREELVYFLIFEDRQNVHVYANDRRINTIEMTHPVEALCKPRFEIKMNRSPTETKEAEGHGPSSQKLDTKKKDNSGAFDEVLFALGNKTVVMVRLGRENYEVQFSFNVKGSKPICQLGCYNNLDRWGLTILLERGETCAEVYQESLSNIYEFRYRVSFKESILDLFAVRLFKTIDAFFVLFKSGIFGVVVERSAFLEHLGGKIDISKVTRALESEKAALGE